MKPGSVEVCGNVVMGAVTCIPLHQFHNILSYSMDDLEGLLLQRDLFVQRFGQLYAAMTWYGRFGNDSQDIQLPIWDHFEGLRHVAGEMCFHVEECGLGCRWPKLLSHEIRWR